MIAWWDSLSLTAQIFACIAIPTSLLLAIQTVLMLIGIGEDSVDSDGFWSDDISLDSDGGADGLLHDIIDGDMDPNGLDAFRLFTIRGIISFLVVFGWVGYLMENAGVKLYITLSVSAVCGIAMMTLLAWLVHMVMKLKNNGNTDNRNAIGVSGKVYLTVPAKRQGGGKINVMLQGTFVDRDAVTDEAEDIPTGCEVVVTGVSGQTTLVVMRK